MATQTKRNQTRKDNEMQQLYAEMHKHQQRAHEIQLRIESLQQTKNVNTSTAVVDTPRAEKQHNVAHTKTWSPSTTETEPRKVFTDNDISTNAILQWQPPEDGIIQSHRGATATVSINRFDNLYNTEEREQDSKNIRWVLQWVPQLDIRHELLEYQRRHLRTRTATTNNKSRKHTRTSTTMSTLLTKPRRRQEPQHRKAKTPQTKSTQESSPVQAQIPTAVRKQQKKKSISSTTNDVTSQRDSISSTTTTLISQDDEGDTDQYNGHKRTKQNTSTSTFPTTSTNRSFTRKQNEPTATNRRFKRKQNGPTAHTSTNGNTNATDQLPQENDNGHDEDITNKGDSDENHNISTNTRVPTPHKDRSPRQRANHSSHEYTQGIYTTSARRTNSKNIEDTKIIATTDPTQPTTTATNSTTLSSTELDDGLSTSPRPTVVHTTTQKYSNTRTPTKAKAQISRDIPEGHYSHDSTHTEHNMLRQWTFHYNSTQFAESTQRNGEETRITAGGVQDNNRDSEYDGGTSNENAKVPEQESQKKDSTTRKTGGENTTPLPKE